MKASFSSLQPAQNSSGAPDWIQTTDGYHRPIMRLMNDISLAMANNKRLAAVLIDFSQAFDSVWHEGLLDKLLSLNIPLPLVQWINDFLQGRKFKIRFNGLVSEEAQEFVTGVPQGSPLSPLLFIIFTCDMTRKSCSPTNSSRSFQVGSYADDTAIWADRRNLLDTKKTLQKQLFLISQWCRKWRLSLNPSKCETIVFGYRGGRPPGVSLEIDGKPIKQVSEVNCLGCVLSSGLGFAKHLDLMFSKLKRRIGALRSMAQSRMSNR